MQTPKQIISDLEIVLSDLKHPERWLLTPENVKGIGALLEDVLKDLSNYDLKPKDSRTVFDDLKCFDINVHNPFCKRALEMYEYPHGITIKGLIIFINSVLENVSIQDIDDSSLSAMEVSKRIKFLEDSLVNVKEQLQLIVRIIKRKSFGYGKGE